MVEETWYRDRPQAIRRLAFRARCRVFAWISLILSILSAIGIVLLPQMGSPGDFFGPYASFIGSGTRCHHHGLLVLVWAVCSFRMLYAMGEIILLQIAVEEKYSPHRSAHCSRCTRIARSTAESAVHAGGLPVDLPPVADRLVADIERAAGDAPSRKRTVPLTAPFSTLSRTR